MIQRIYGLVLVLALLCAAAPLGAIEQASSKKGATTAITAEAPLNINTATAADLERLPGIGPATAQRVIEFREKNGAFKKVEDLMHVRGIGEKTFLTLKPLIIVAPPKGHGVAG
jgi:competence protein ComEA